MADTTARVAVRAYRRPGSGVTGLRGLIHVNCTCRVASTLVGKHGSAKEAEAQIRDMGYSFNYCSKSTHTASQENSKAAPVVEAVPVVEGAAAVEAPAVEESPRVHRFDDTDTAYDITQTEEGVHRGICDGDVLVVESEGVVGVLTNSWPVALTEVHGQFHLMSERYLIREMNDGRYAASADAAERVAAGLGLLLLPQHRATVAVLVAGRECDVIEGVVVTHDGTAQGSLPEDASHPDVAAARDALAGLAVATLTDHHDVHAPRVEERNVRGYFVEPRGRGRVAVYWLEAGKIVRRDEAVNGAALDCLADRLQRRGWRTERMLNSSQCVFAYRPAERATRFPAIAAIPAAGRQASNAPAPVQEPASARKALVKAVLDAGGDEQLAGSTFVKGDRIVCPDGAARTVEGMAPRVPGEPEHVIVEAGAAWIAANCLRANREDVRAAHERSSAAAARVRTTPDATNPEWCAALKDLTAALDYLKAADPQVRAALAEVDAKDAEDAARRTHADAHNFQPFHRPGEQAPAGWTFRTGYGAHARYGVVTAGAGVAPIGLYEYVTTAQRALLQAEKNTPVGQA